MEVRLDFREEVLRREKRVSEREARSGGGGYALSAIVLLMKVWNSMLNLIGMKEGRSEVILWRKFDAFL